MTLELPRTTYRQGETIDAELIMENRSDRRIYYHEGDWPYGLLHDETLVGGIDNQIGRNPGLVSVHLEPGEVRRYPAPTDEPAAKYGYLDWGGESILDTLACRRTSQEERRPLPPGTYIAMVSVPTREQVGGYWAEGAQARTTIRIVP